MEKIRSKINKIRNHPRSSHLVYIRVKSGRNFRSVVNGIATLYNQKLIYEVVGDTIRPDDGNLLKSSLSSGKEIMMFLSEDSQYIFDIANIWGRHSESFSGETSYNSIKFEPTRNPETAGTLIIIHNTDKNIGIRNAYHWDLEADEISALEELGENIDITITEFGRKWSPTIKDISLKSLCNLHELDSEKKTPKPIMEFSNDDGYVASWTDVKEILQSQPDQWIFDYLLQKDKIDQEKYDFAIGAIDFLDKRRGEGGFRWGGIGAYRSIYDVVWFSRINFDDYIFRGQFNAEWPLQSSLMRHQDGNYLDINILYDRLAQTEEFIVELEKIQKEVFGKRLDQKSLLAIAQHFGFPTPLLDFTTSFKIAAFFATLGAESMKDEDKITGVIYYIRKGESLNNLKDPGRHLGLSILDLAGINFGNLDIIEPDIPDEDNRIKRQEGVFISDFSTADLNGVAIDKKFFVQQKGEVFRDDIFGVSEKKLLPDKTLVSEQAKKIKNSHKPKKTYSLLGNTKLYKPSIVGSNGALLYAYIKDSDEYFNTLNKYVEKNLSENDRSFIQGLFIGYFTDVRKASDVGDLASPEPEVEATRPIAQVVEKLSNWAGCEEPSLWQVVRDEMAEGFSEFRRHSEYLRQDKLEPKSYKERVALICIYYFVAWEYIVNVDGIRGKDLISESINLFQRIFPWQWDELRKKKSD
jgi:hypothetical protein